jgi:hypothetical protein
MGEKRLKQRIAKLLLDAFQFLGISTRNWIPNNRGIFKLRSNKRKHNTYIHKFEGREREA